MIKYGREWRVVNVSRDSCVKILANSSNAVKIWEDEVKKW